jgi:hypothetical protein
MAITVKHSKVSTIPDDADTSLVRPSDWNADHTLTGTIPVENGGTGASTAAAGLNNLLPSQTGNNGKVLATDGTNATWTSNGSGDVVGPASATDNAVARYDATTGKLIQNSVVIIGDTGSVTGVNALTAESLVVNNNATLGSSNTDSIDVRGRISSDLEPETNNAKDIGTNGRNWRDAFFGRTIHTVNLELTGTTSFDGAQGTAGQVLTSAGTGNTPTWTTPTTGTVTSVTGTAPVVSSGGATPAISMAAATGSVNGYLTSTDWTTFNNKGSGTVTSITAGTGLSGGTITTTGTIAIDSTVATLTGTQTLTNKRVTNRIGSNGGTTSGNITPTSDTADQYNITGLTGTSAIQIPSGTPTDGQRLSIRIKDNGTGRTLSWVTTAGGYRVIGTTLPLTTTANKTIYVGCVYNVADSFWDVVAVAEQA